MPLHPSPASGGGGGDDCGIAFGPFADLGGTPAPPLRLCPLSLLRVPSTSPLSSRHSSTPWYPSCLPLCPAWEEGAIARGGLSSLLPSCAIGIFLRTTIIDDALPPLAFCAPRCAFCPTSRYWLEFNYRQGSSGGLTNYRNDDDEGATARVTLPSPSGDGNAAPPDHLLRSRRCRNGGVSTPALRSCRGVNNGKEG